MRGQKCNHLTVTCGLFLSYFEEATVEIVRVHPGTILLQLQGRKNQLDEGERGLKRPRRNSQRSINLVVIFQKKKKKVVVSPVQGIQIFPSFFLFARDFSFIFKL